MRNKSATPDWLRVQQAADLLAVSATTVRRWADSGRLACRRTPSGQRRFSRLDLERSMAPGARGGGATAAAAGAEQRYQLLLDTSLELASTLDLDEVLQSAARRLGTVLEIPDCDIYRLEDDETMVCVASALDGVYDTTWVGHEVRLDEWPFDRLALQTGHAVTARSLDDPRLSKAEREDMHRYGQLSMVSLPLIARDKVVGLVDLLDHVEREFTEEEIAIAEAVGQLVALALEHAELYEEVKNLHLGNLRALSSALSAKDYYTLGHANRVAAYMALLGRELGWPDERLEEVENVAFLHDIGKIGVSDRVLLKAGPLTSEEWELIRQHPGISAEIVRPLFDEALVAGVRHHHERFDGKGYPDGLAGEDIPRLARAMCVVDCYDAMSCERPYRPALSYRQCLAELRRCAGVQFDPAMVTAFLRVLQHLRRRRTWVTKLAQEAARLIDPAAHVLLRTRADEARPEYREMVTALRAFRDSHAPLRYVTTFALQGDQCITVLDTGDSEDEISHCGDPWLAEDELARVLAQERTQANVLNADDFGVWVSGIAPVRDKKGAIVAAVTVDAPIVDSRTRDAQTDRSHTLAAMLQSAAIRFSRAEVEAITDGLTGLYNHRYLHELLDKADWAMYQAKGAGRNRVLAFGDDRVARETWLSRRGR
jgi:excisionase family DNA binding protein